MVSNRLFILRTGVSLLYLLTIMFFHENEMLCTAIIVSLLIISLFTGGFQKVEVCLALAVGLLGPIAEMFAIITGAWVYSHASILIVPLWLFPLWSGAALYIYRLGRRLECFKMPKAAHVRLLFWTNGDRLIVTVPISRPH